MIAEANKAWIGLGGNVGDVRAAMIAALERLDSSDGIAVKGVSRLYATPPWGLKNQPDFLNSAAELEVRVDPFALLEACQDAERALKRERTLRWGPRTIDLDILAIEDVTLNEQRLTVPHPRLQERAFALAPLADLAPGLAISGRRVSELLGQSDANGIVPISRGGEWREKNWERNEKPRTRGVR